MKKILLLSTALLFLFACKKDQEQDFVFEPMLVKTVVVEMDTFNTGSYTINSFSMNARNAAETALQGSEYANYSQFEILEITMQNVSLSNIVSSYSNLEEIDSVVFSLNGYEVFQLESDFLGGYAPINFPNTAFNFINVFEHANTAGLDDEYQLALLPKPSATSAKNRYTLSFSYQAKIVGVYSKD